ncbi:MAG: rRNA pseudouridine synthase [Clostridiales bacterium]|nr:rRNA pseudouridine synthase [Clostridiales bacterium]
MKERLQKILSMYGIASRRHSEELIQASKVTVNGIVASLGSLADPDVDEIAVDGIRLQKKPENVYIMLNKPSGYITSLSDEKGRRTVLSLLSDLPDRVYPVGRLDYNSEGLLLMTNDGGLAYRLTHPKHNVEKTYIAAVSGDLKQAIPLLSSEMLIDGYRIQPAKVKEISTTLKGGIVSITIHEGRNRQIRKMCEQNGLAVLKLKRISIGNLKLNNLPVGKWRYLTEDEIAYLHFISQKTGY